MITNAARLQDRMLSQLTVLESLINFHAQELKVHKEAGREALAKMSEQSLAKQSRKAQVLEALIASL